MADDNKDGNSTKLSLGPNTDAAIADVLRGLLQRPATEIGNLFSDAIGILADKMQKKRAANMQLGLPETMGILESRGIDVKDITPPPEEELYLLLEGMSLSGDAGVRKLWSGLFATALDPTTDATAERSFISVLQSLSPVDVKILDFIAFIVRSDLELSGSLSKPVFKEMRRPTPEEVAQADEVHRLNRERADKFVEMINEKGEEYNLQSTLDTGWSSNLMRQGLIVRTSKQNFSEIFPSMRFGNERDAAQAYNYINQQLSQLNRFAKESGAEPSTLYTEGPVQGRIVLEVQFSPFGRKLVEACGLL